MSQDWRSYNIKVWGNEGLAQTFRETSLQSDIEPLNNSYKVCLYVKNLFVDCISFSNYVNVWEDTVRAFVQIVYTGYKRMTTEMNVHDLVPYFW